MTVPPPLPASAAPTHASPPPAPFRVETAVDRTRAVAAAHGELDLSTVDAFEAAVRQLRADDHAEVVLDLRGLSFIDSTGLQLLLHLDEAAHADGWALTIVDGDGPVRRLLELTGLARHFAVGRRAMEGMA